MFNVGRIKVLLHPFHFFYLHLNYFWGGGGFGGWAGVRDFLCVFFFLFFSIFVVMNRQSFIFNVKCVMKILTTALFHKVAFERHNKYKRLVFLYVFLHVDIRFFFMSTKDRQWNIIERKHVLLKTHISVFWQFS